MVQMWSVVPVMVGVRSKLQPTSSPGHFPWGWGPRDLLGCGNGAWHLRRQFAQPGPVHGRNGKLLAPSPGGGVTRTKGDTVDIGVPLAELVLDLGALENVGVLTADVELDETIMGEAGSVPSS